MTFEDRCQGQHFVAAHGTAGQGVTDEDTADEGCRTASETAGRRNGIDQFQRAALRKGLALLDGDGLHSMADHIFVKNLGQLVGSESFNFHGNRVFARFFRKINVIVQVQRNTDGIETGADVSGCCRNLCMQCFCHFLHLNYTNGIFNFANA